MHRDQLYNFSLHTRKKKHKHKKSKEVFQYYFYLFCIICGVGLFGTAATTGLLYQPRMMRDGIVEKLVE
jgi:hypothetical protein